MAGDPHRVTPKPLLSVTDGVFLTVGMILGALIFKAPSDVAQATSSSWTFLGAWVLGGVAVLCGALVYAELAARHPDTGGEYVFLRRGWGAGVAFLFAWSRMTVIQTGAIAAVAFVFGEYMSQIVAFEKNSAAIWAAISVVALTLLNLVGTRQSKTVQKIMEISLIAGLVILSVWAIAVGGAKPAPAASSGGGSFGFAMILVLLAYGGWNEAAYLAGEVRDAKRNMTRILVIGVLAVTALYLLVNIGYLAVLGHEGLRQSKTVAVDVMRIVAGDKGALIIAVIVCVSVLTTVNAAIFTGARTNYAFGKDVGFLGKMGTWRDSGSTPANAVIIQGAIALLLVGVGSTTPDGFTAMVNYTTPVFWVFMYLTGSTLFVFRERHEETPPFRVPWFPHIPIAFLVTCLYMLYSSTTYALFGTQFGYPALIGLVVMALGVPLYFLSKTK